MRFLLLLLVAPLFAADTDRDGIDDALEQALLQRFPPSFTISGGECDVAPAQFAPNSAEPRALTRNGTIYGQVLRHDAGRVELHYYHLWTRDCGRFGHALDAEHVSALVRGEPANPVEKWRAEYWYAAAHEDTLCDAARAARAATINAEEHGPQVWISRGKHGSFLTVEACRGGCGGDRCETGKPLAVAGVVNIGEPGAPMNGAIWAASPRWPLAAKMFTDFAPQTLTRVDEGSGIVDLRGARVPAQSVIAGGERTITEAGGAKKRTGEAVSGAEGRTEHALGKSATETGKAITGTKKSVSDWLRRTL